MNKSGKDLIEFAHQLKINNIFFHDNAQHKYTWKVIERQSVTYYIITNRTMTLEKMQAQTIE